jgi:hypothetical protein
MHFGQDAAIAFSEMVSRNIVKSNPDSNQLFTRNSQPVRLITGESSEYGNQSSAPKIDVGDADRVVLVNQYYNNFFVENPSVLSQTLGTGVKESDADARLNNMVLSLSQIICPFDNFTKIKKCN